VSASQAQFQIGTVWITVDVKIQSFSVVLARPLAIPYFPSRIITVEERTAERLPTAMRTAFDVAASTIALANRRTAIGTLLILARPLMPQSLTFRGGFCKHAGTPHYNRFSLAR
jgi:hypothetical protein